MYGIITSQCGVQVFVFCTQIRSFKNKNYMKKFSKKSKEHEEAGKMHEKMHLYQTGCARSIVSAEKSMEK